MAKRTKQQLTKDAFIAHGDDRESSDDENGLQPPQPASAAIMAGRKIAGMGRKFGRKVAVLTEPVSNTDTDDQVLSQKKSLNANFLKSINDGITKNPVADLSAICTKYIDYIVKINNKKIEVKNLNVPKVEVKPEILKPAEDEKKPNPFAAFASFGSSTPTPAAAPKPLAFNPTPASAPAPAPAQAPAAQAQTPIDVDSGDESDSSVKSEKKEITIAGPKFTLTELPKSKDYGFKFGKAPPKDDSDSEDEIEIKGPTFQLNAKVADPTFKLAPKTEQKPTISEPITTKPVAPTTNGFTFGAVKSEPKESKAADAIAPAPTFSFGAPKSEQQPTASTPASTGFKFGQSNPAPATSTTPSFSFTQPAKKDESAPKFTFGANNTTSAFNFGADKSDKLDTKTNDTTSSLTPTFNFGSSNSKPAFSANPALSFGKPAAAGDDLVAKTNPFSFGGTTTSGSSIPSMTFNFTAPKPTTPAVVEEATTTDADNADEEVEKDTVKGDFTVVKLSETVDVKTGEEDEEVIAFKRSKLSKFNPESKGYDQVGLGELKVLKNKNTGKSRLLLRADGSSNVLLNIAIVKEMKYELLGDKKNMLRIPAVTADGSLATYMARVKTGADGEELLNAIQSCQ